MTTEHLLVGFLLVSTALIVVASLAWYQYKKMRYWRKQVKTLRHLQQKALEDPELDLNLAILTGDVTKHPGSKILLVSAQPQFFLSLQGVLEPYDFSCLRANETFTALHLLEHYPDIATIFVDLSVESADGLDFVRTMRREVSFKEIPVICMLDTYQSALVRDVYKVGATDYLIKDFDSADFHSRFQTHLGFREQSIRLRKISEKLQLEMYAKTDLVRDLAHRGNNPLQAGMAAFGNLSREIQMLLALFDAMVSDEYQQDPEILALRDTLRKTRNNIVREQDYINRNYDRISRAISEIRVVSGVDGYDQSTLDFRDCIRDARNRLVEQMGAHAIKRLQIDIQESNHSWRMRAHPTVLAIALERVFYQTLRDYDDNVHFEVRNFDDREDASFIFQVASHESAAFTGECKDLVRNIDHMLHPFGLSMRLGPEAQTIILERTTTLNSVIKKAS